MRSIILRSGAWRERRRAVEACGEASWWELLRELYFFSFDKRTLGLSRIAIGFLMLMDLAHRGRVWSELYSDEGILPAHVVLAHRQADNFSLFHALRRLASRDRALAVGTTAAEPRGMKLFLASSSGRLLSFAFALAFAGTGVAKLIGPSGLAVGAMSVFAAVTLTVVALTTAVNEHSASAAIAVLALPWLLFLGQVGQALLASGSAGYALVIVGLAAAAFALRPGAQAAHVEPAMAVSRSVQRT